VDGIYRVPPTVAEAPRDAGIVGEVIGQFADTFAFLRELVQNSIDAGTPQVDVHLERELDAPVIRAIVRDQGEGMTRDVIENQLLVLFRSTKEHDDSKIGKFGIGFASVLSPQPNVVVVHTSRDGRRLTLHLQRDLSYELFDAGPSSRAGTSVELEIPLTTSFDAFVTASQSALVRWCRHAAVPIRLVVRDGGATTLDQRIDRPLALDHAVIEVRETSADGLTTAVVGITEDATPYGGFFDHGLTLYEDIAPVIGRYAFKVQDARLAHTLSRDNVRRDPAYDRAVAFAREVAERALPAAATTALAAAAERGDRPGYRALVEAVVAAGVRIGLDQWSFPLIEPMGGLRAVTRDALGARPYGARATSSITAMLAAAGSPVLDLGAAGELEPHLEVRIGDRIREVHRELSRVTPVEPTDADRALLGLVGELIAAAHRKPGALALGVVEGALAGYVSITGDPTDAAIPSGADRGAPWLIDRRRGGRRPFGLFGRASLVISVRHAEVATARTLAATDPVAAASLLARLLLLGAGALDTERSDRLMSATLAALGVRDPR